MTDRPKCPKCSGAGCAPCYGSGLAERVYVDAGHGTIHATGTHDQDPYWEMAGWVLRQLERREGVCSPGRVRPAARRRGAGRPGRPARRSSSRAGASDSEGESSEPGEARHAAGADVEPYATRWRHRFRGARTPGNIDASVRRAA